MTKEMLIEKFTTFFETVLTTPALAFADLVSPKCVWENYLPENVPFRGRYEGIQALVQYLTVLTQTIVMGPLEFTEFYAETETNTLIVAGVEKDSLVISTNRKYTMSFVWIAKFNEEGRLIYCRENNDSAAISAAFD